MKNKFVEGQVIKNFNPRMKNSCHKIKQLLVKKQITKAHKLRSINYRNFHPIEDRKKKQLPH